MPEISNAEMLPRRRLTATSSRDTTRRSAAAARATGTPTAKPNSLAAASAEQSQLPAVISRALSRFMNSGSWRIREMASPATATIHTSGVAVGMTTTRWRPIDFGHHPAEIGVGRVLFARGEVVALRPVRLGLAARRQPLAALGGENQQIAPDRRRGSARIAGGRGPAPCVRRIERSSGTSGRPMRSPSPRTIGGRTMVIGTRSAIVLGGPFARPLAVAVVRDGLGSIGFGLRPTVVGRTGRRQRRDRDQHRRSRLPGADLGDVRHAALIDAIEVPRRQRLRASGEVVDDRSDRPRRPAGCCGRSRRRTASRAPASRSESTRELCRTRHVTSSPRAAKVATRCVPMNPLAPVTKTLAMRQETRN